MGLPDHSDIKESTCSAGDVGSVPGWEYPLEKGLATHRPNGNSSIPVWRILWTQESSGLQSVGSQKVRHDGQLTLSLSNIINQTFSGLALTYNSSSIFHHASKLPFQEILSIPLTLGMHFSTLGPLHLFSLCLKKLAHYPCLFN